MAESMIYKSPIGNILIRANEAGVTELVFTEDADPSPRGSLGGHLNVCALQLDEYFDGSRTSFDVPVDLKGSPFQISVWRALMLIPYGSTWSYGKLAAQVGRPKASRAVGGANHNNPVSIIIPCHRVIGSNGKLIGYGGGLWRKEWLLKHESGKMGS
ncbi:MAG: methylated-DNA--[protein]-cysteine S-methyltransferase [Synergistaceae bacterium]|jgi:methylated-DNA-[protein]-cysteine S-methyltransferase|nr:methylated-DNA--[protein]-cysteine S-methyltransferase [Synergistaceae bacterium]